MNSYEVRFNRSRFEAATIEEADSLAYSLIEASCPFDAKILQVDDNGEVSIVKTLGPAEARHLN